MQEFGGVLQRQCSIHPVGGATRTTAMKSQAMRGKTLQTVPFWPFFWVHRELPQSAVIPAPPRKKTHRSQTGCNHTFTTKPWLPLNYHSTNDYYPTNYFGGASGQASRNYLPRPFIRPYITWNDPLANSCRLSPAPAALRQQRSPGKMSFDGGGVRPGNFKFRWIQGALLQNPQEVIRGRIFSESFWI